MGTGDDRGDDDGLSARPGGEAVGARPGAALKRLPLHETHRLLGAKFAAFGGFRMPTFYTSIVREHFQVRRAAGLFDVSHMGRLLLRGPGARRTMQRLVASDLAGLDVGEARYTVLLTPWGGIRDDLIVYRREDGLLLVVNAANLAGDREWIGEHLEGDTTMDDLTDATCLFALQGPAALAVLDRLSSASASEMPPFSFGTAGVAGIETTVMRTGYTGEQGAELMVRHDDADRLWNALLSIEPDEVVRPCGLGARDTLRLEAALLLHGQDMDENTTPYEARLGWLTHLEKSDRSDFVGREALLEAQTRGPVRLLAGLATEARTIPRPGDTLLKEGIEVGTVTSGAPSPILGHPIALGYLPPALAETGTDVVVRSAGGRLTPARVAARPFYKRGETPIPEQRRSARATAGPTGGDR